MQTKTIRSVTSALFLAVSSLVWGHGPRNQGTDLVHPIVGVGEGLIRGTVSDVVEGVWVFRGIPYATPPIGELRWRSPQPRVPWDGVLRCDRFACACPQPEPLMGSLPEPVCEDCLYLNVWTPSLGDARLPVMVWIHGGGWTTGAGSSPLYEGSRLAEMGVVLVTINYRLGPLGFLAHPLLSDESPDSVSGNYGMLDQIQALVWLQENVSSFGGDPDNVTIFGESAGGGSVARLMVSPLAEGLFHRAVVQSGAAFGSHRHLTETWYGLEPMENIGLQLARDLQCDEVADPLAALRSIAPDRIIQAADPSQGLFGEGAKYWPVVDGYVLPDDPGALFDRGLFHDVSLMIGTVKDEATFFIQAQLPLMTVSGYQWLIDSWFEAYAQEVLALYPAYMDSDVPDALNRLVTDSAFVAPARCLIRAHEGSEQQAFLYHFTRIPIMADLMGLGSFHGLEIAYVFGNMTGLMFVDQHDTDLNLSQSISRYWVQFARSGDPNVDGLPHWPAYDTDSDPHLEMGDVICAHDHLHADGCDLFETYLTWRRNTRTQ